MNTRTCYCRRRSHEIGTVEKCDYAPPWKTLKAQRDALLEAAEAVKSMGIRDYGNGDVACRFCGLGDEHGGGCPVAKCEAAINLARGDE